MNYVAGAGLVAVAICVFVFAMAIVKVASDADDHASGDKQYKEE